MNFIKKFEKLTESIFENTSSQSPLPKKIYLDVAEFQFRNNFNIEKNNILLERIFESNDSQLFFSRLSSFFEIGILIENQKISNCFAFGEIYNGENKELQFKLPRSKILSLLKTNATSLFNKLGLDFLQDKQSYTGLLIRTQENQYILLFTILADPWLKMRCESLKKALYHHDYESN